MAEVIVTMEVGSDGIALITISNPPVNALALPVLAGLKEKFVEAMNRDDVKAIVLTGRNGRFSSGFDINVLEKVQTTGVSVELVTNIIEDGKKPTVAAIQGFALGGGLEVAMGCHARIAAPRTQLGLPELALGVIPGFGGTQRLPRLLGLSKAIDMLLTTKPILSEEGIKLRLIDAIVPPQDLLKVSRQWALDIAEARKPWARSLHRMEKIGSLSEAREIIKNVRQLAKRMAPNMPQHQACLDVIEEGIVHGGYVGVLKEVKVFNELVCLDTSKGLVHIFFAQRAIFKVPKVTDVGLKPRAIKKVGVIGGGLMGSGIATTLILGNINVVLKEVNSEYLQTGLKPYKVINTPNIRSLVARKKLSQAQAEKSSLMIKGVLDYSEFRDVDMVIEAVTENVPLKQKIFSEIEDACPPHFILATNTSTIDLNLIGDKIKSKDRLVGAHFFRSHFIIRFAVGRTFFPYTHGAHILVHLGVDLFRIDRLIISFGFPIGPFQLQDLIGYGVAVAIGKEYVNAYPDRSFQSPIVDLLIKSGRNGKNNGKGYYIHEKGSKPKPDPQVYPIIEEARRLTNILPAEKRITVTDQEIVEMILFPVVNEACRVLEEGIMVRASDLDVSSLLGMSFPSYRGGIVFWGDLVGAKHIYASLKIWSEKYGDFYKPSRFLEERAKTGLPLSAPLSTSASSRARL